MNEQELCRKKLIDLSKQADRKGIVLFSSFLNLDEQNIYHQARNVFATKTESSGGVPGAERQMIAFIPDALSYEWEYPVTALRITPAAPKFAEQLGHRDILGALMTLGVDRGRIGDIIVGEDGYYFLCESGLASYFEDHLDRIRHTAVRAEAVPLSGIQIQQSLAEKEGIVTSDRLDAVLACVHRLSRSQASSLLKAEKVAVNGRTITSPSFSCRENDIVSVRGYGRFQYLNIYGETKKGRLKMKYLLYQ